MWDVYQEMNGLTHWSFSVKLTSTCCPLISSHCCICFGLAISSFLFYLPDVEEAAVTQYLFRQIIENELAETYQELWSRLLELIRAAVKG